MNEISYEICSKDPSMVLDRKKLLESARMKLHDSGYMYKKGQSRSKVLKPSSIVFPSMAKRVTPNLRLKRISTLSEDIKDTSDQISFKEKRRDVAQNVKDYKMCEELTDSIIDLREKKRELEVEHDLLVSKQARLEKKRRSSSMSDETSFPPSSEDDYTPDISSDSASTPCDSQPIASTCSEFAVDSEPRPFSIFSHGNASDSPSPFQ